MKDIHTVRVDHAGVIDGILGAVLGAWVGAHLGGHLLDVAIDGDVNALAAACTSVNRSNQAANSFCRARGKVGRAGAVMVR